MAQTDRTTGLVGETGCKVPVRAATTAAIVLSGTQTVDGVVLAVDDRVLVKNQASSVANGIYVVDTGDWTRAKDCDGSNDLRKGSIVGVTDGTVGAGLFYRCTSANPIVVGTDAITWVIVTPSSAVPNPVTVVLGGTGQDTATEAATAFGVVQLTGGAGTANAQTAAAPSNYVNAALNLIEYTPAVTNTGATTITITPAGGVAQAARNIFFDGLALTGSELVLGVPTILYDDGVQMHIVGYSRKISSRSLGESNNLINGTIVQTRAGSAETIAIKTLAGADPSAADPVGVKFRDQSSLTGGYVTRWLTAALSLTISSGSTMGARNSIPFRLWYVLFDDAGTVRLAAINCVTSVAGVGTGSDVTAIYPLGGYPVASSTAEGGAGAADSAQVFYTGVAVASKPYVPIGYATWEAGLAAVGTWGTAPSRIHLYARGTPLPGQVIQAPRNDTGAVASGATTIPDDDSIPQIGEGDQYMSQAITPNSAANVVRVGAQVVLTSDAAGATGLMAALFQDATANALKAVRVVHVAANNALFLLLNAAVLAGTSASTTYKIRAGDSSAGTTTFNGSGGGRKMGGADNSYIEAVEVMG